MPQCKGVPTDQPANARESRTFCEGLGVATRGGVAGDNPHPSGSVDASNWDKGFNAYGGGIGTSTRVCCADLAYDGVP